MSQRETTIRVTAAQRQELAEIARSEYDTDEIPFGVVVERLADEVDP